MTAIERKHVGSRMSKIVRHGDVIYLCGQTASGTAIADAAGQTREILARIDALLAEAGTDRSRRRADHLRRGRQGAEPRLRPAGDRPLPTRPARYSIGGIAGPAGAGFSAITQSVVRIRPATDEACCRPSRVTLVGSMTPMANMSPYCSLARL